MIEFVRGYVSYSDTQFIVVDVNGVGYQLYCANPFVYKVDLQTEIVVYTYQYVREDTIKLFGFCSREERNLFEQLINVSGIGPKGALAILAAGQPEQLVAAIEEENEQFLIKFPGVGKKTARQMILDLKGKLAGLSTDGIYKGAQFLNEKKNIYPQQLEDALAALQALGYHEKEISKIAPQLAKQQLSTDQYLKQALQLLLKM